MVSAADGHQGAAECLGDALAAGDRGDRVVLGVQDERLGLELVAVGVDGLGDRVPAHAVVPGGLDGGAGGESVAAGGLVDLGRHHAELVGRCGRLIARDDRVHLDIGAVDRRPVLLGREHHAHGLVVDPRDLATVVVVLQDMGQHRPRLLAVGGAHGGVVEPGGGVVGQALQGGGAGEALDACAARRGRVDHVERRTLEGGSAQLHGQVADLRRRRGEVRGAAHLLVGHPLPGVEHLQRGVTEAVVVVALGDPSEDVVDSLFLRERALLRLLRPAPVGVGVGVEHHLAGVLREQGGEVGADRGAVGHAQVVDLGELERLADRVGVPRGVLRRHGRHVGGIGAEAGVVQRVDGVRSDELDLAHHRVGPVEPARLHGHQVVVLVQPGRRRPVQRRVPEVERVVTRSARVAEDGRAGLPGGGLDAGQRDLGLRSVGIVIVDRHVDGAALHARGQVLGLDPEHLGAVMPLDRGGRGQP